MSTTVAHTPRLLPSGWRSELLYFALAWVDILWLTPWFLVLMPGGESLNGAQIVLFVAAHVLTALLIVRSLTRRGASDLAMQAAFFVGLIVAALITVKIVLPMDGVGALPPLIAGGKLFIPPIVVSVGLVVMLWFRGLTIGTITVTTARATYALRVGIILEIGAALMPNARVQNTVLVTLPFFFFIGLMATGQARSASLRINRDQQRSSFGIGWTAFMAILGAAISLIGFVTALWLGGVDTGGVAAVLKSAISSILGLIFSILYPLFAPLANLLAQALDFLANRPKAASNSNGPSWLKLGPQDPAAQHILSYLPILGLIGSIVVAVLILALVLHNRSRARLLADEEHESLEGTAILGSVGATLQRALAALRDALANLTRFGLNAGEAHTIRRLYAELTALAEKHGHPRPETQTPREYLPTLIKAFPAFAHELDRLTGAYIDVHYGELPDDPGALAAAQVTIDQLKVLDVKDERST